MTLAALSSLSAALTLVSLMALSGSSSPFGTLVCFFKVRLAFRTALAASARSDPYPVFSRRWSKDVRCLTYASPPAPLPRIDCLCSPSGVLILTVFLVVIISRLLLDAAEHCIWDGGLLSDLTFLAFGVI